MAGVILHHQVTVQEEGAGLVEFLLSGPQSRPGKAREEGLRARRDKLRKTGLEIVKTEKG